MAPRARTLSDSTRERVGRINTITDARDDVENQPMNLVSSKESPNQDTRRRRGRRHEIGVRRRDERTTGGGNCPLEDRRLEPREVPKLLRLPGALRIKRTRTTNSRWQGQERVPLQMINIAAWQSDVANKGSNTPTEGKASRL